MMSAILVCVQLVLAACPSSHTARADIVSQATKACQASGVEHDLAGEVVSSSMPAMAVYVENIQRQICP